MQRNLPAVGKNYPSHACLIRRPHVILVLLVAVKSMFSNKIRRRPPHAAFAVARQLQREDEGGRGAWMPGGGLAFYLSMGVEHGNGLFIKTED
ncbi:MAG: hypothetical protein IH624_06010 [Phycisphaerae bacterium]|nr:hypothetical protein [Phycisphaerae bacterium]